MKLVYQYHGKRLATITIIFFLPDEDNMRNPEFFGKINLCLLSFIIDLFGILSLIIIKFEGTKFKSLAFRDIIPWNLGECLD